MPYATRLFSQRCHYYVDYATLILIFAADIADIMLSRSHKIKRGEQSAARRQYVTAAVTGATNHAAPYARVTPCCQDVVTAIIAALLRRLRRHYYHFFHYAFRRRHAYQLMPCHAIRRRPAAQILSSMPPMPLPFAADIRLSLLLAATIYLFCAECMPCMAGTSFAVYLLMMARGGRRHNRYAARLSVRRRQCHA